MLGGTSEGRAIARSLDENGHEAILSFAGRTASPVTSGVARVRTGGFGGAEGLVDYLTSEGITAVVDATHPFADAMTKNAVQACAAAGVPLLKLERPGWSNHPQAKTWHWVEDHREAAATAAGLGDRVLLTIGRQFAGEYVEALGDRFVLVRLVQNPDEELPDPWQVHRSRGPWTVETERELFAEHGINVMVTKDSGGSYTEAKLHVAAEQGVEVVIIRRPELPQELTKVATIDEVLAWLS